VPDLSQDVWGNGAAIACVLAHNGVKLFGCDLHLDAAQRTIARLRSLLPNCVIDVVRGDVTRLEHVKKTVEACIAKHGRIDILINNVGMTRSGDPVTMSEEDWDEQLDMNLKSVFVTCKVVLPIMEKQELKLDNLNEVQLSTMRVGLPFVILGNHKSHMQVPRPHWFNSPSIRLFCAAAQQATSQDMILS
jgi:NAD(P)-dependent dehydrogenase (short-subunit alcohol dehydrogenase family)